MTNPPPMHMHGSNLLVRSDIEDSIGWNFGPTLAEDEIFGYKIYDKYGSKSLDWHGGILLEQPPLNITILCKDVDGYLVDCKILTSFQ